jgi:hypothetical protein
VEGPRRNARGAKRGEPTPELVRCLPRERDRKDLRGRESAADDLIRDAPRNRRRLSRAGAGENANGATQNLDRSTLFGIQPAGDPTPCHLDKP